jgi:hypothetical protein
VSHRGETHDNRPPPISCDTRHDDRTTGNGFHRSRCRARDPRRGKPTLTHVRTHSLRAFDADDLNAILDKMR